MTTKYAQYSTPQDNDRNTAGSAFRPLCCTTTRTPEASKLSEVDRNYKGGHLRRSYCHPTCRASYAHFENALLILGASRRLHLLLQLDNGLEDGRRFLLQDRLLSCRGRRRRSSLRLRHRSREMYVASTATAGKRKSERSQSRWGAVALSTATDECVRPCTNCVSTTKQPMTPTGAQAVPTWKTPEP